jgi:site-specific recombinase XerD
MSSVRSALLEIIEKRSMEMPIFNPNLDYSTQGTVIISEVGTPLEPRNLTRCFHNLAKKAGLPKIKIHAMRHTFATIFDIAPLSIYASLISSTSFSR